jgi:hypothetical protein
MQKIKNLKGDGIIVNRSEHWRFPAKALTEDEWIFFVKSTFKASRASGLKGELYMMLPLHDGHGLRVNVYEKLNHHE